MHPEQQAERATRAVRAIVLTRRGARTLAAAITACALLSCAALAGDGEGAAMEPLRYRVSFEGRKNHYLEVEAVIPCDERATLELMQPVWTPGSYQIRDFSRHIEAVAAATLDGTPVAIDKSAKNRWRITGATTSSIAVRYRVYCRDMSVQGNWVDGEFAILNGAATFLTLLDGLERRHEVTLDLPAEWKHALCSLPTAEKEGRERILAADYHALVDSPIYAGNAEPRTFVADGREHVFLHHGGGAVWDGAGSLEDLRRLVETQVAFWNGAPYERYVFFNMVVEGSGGLEHMASTVMMTSRWNFRDRKKYIGWLGLASHEFFHTWNVKRLRPAELNSFDYEREVYTKCLWIAEGLTSYYDDLLLRRAGLISHKEYLEALSKQIENLQTTPGRLTQPLEQSSFDTWIKHYRKDENSPNSAISYYVKGAVVGFLLDAKVRRATQGEKSLDDVIRLLYSRYSGDRGYTSADFRVAVEEVAGADLNGWLTPALEGTSELDYSDALDWFGLRFLEASEDTGGDKEKNGGDAGAGEVAGATDGRSRDGANGPPKEKPKPAWLGLSAHDRGGRLIVSEVRRDTPAFTAGILVDDEILAIDGYRVLPGALDARLEQFKPGDSATLLVARRDEIVSLPIAFGEEPPKRWRLNPLPKPSHDQEAHLSDWLAQTERL